LNTNIAAKKKNIYSAKYKQNSSFYLKNTLTLKILKSVRFNMVDIKKFKEIDLYGLIGVDISANIAEVSCHLIVYKHLLSIFILFFFR
jgi:hypothetical protein